VIAPLSYLEIVSTVILGYLVFNEFPVMTTWVGIALIVASGMVIAWRETMLRRRVRPEFQGVEGGRGS
jgi:drug/metabolite transporter (DMT)-like permease